MGAVALTFDDGPSPATAALIDVLAEHDAKATFFVVGRNGKNRRDLLERMAADGHDIGNHTWSHPSLTGCDNAVIREELERTNELVAAITGAAPVLYRAPYFDLDERVDAVARPLGLRHVSADVKPPDWHDGWTAKLTITSVLSGARVGAIVCLHDGVPPEADDRGRPRTTVDAIEALLPRIAERGLRCVTVSALLGELSSA